MSLRRRHTELRKWLAIGPHVHNVDFWAIVFGRPSAYLLLLFVGDLRWVTPNRLTHISNLLMAAGIAMLFQATHTAYIWAAILLNASIVFDCADGQLARYRGGGTELGSYYDKVADYLGHIPVFAGLGWVTYQETQEAYYLLFALISLSCLLTTGYVKWLAVATLRRYGLEEAPPAPANPRPMSWARYAGRVVLSIFRFAEPDLYFWMGLGLIFDRLPWVMWLLVVTQIPVALAACVYRGMQMARADRTRP